MDNKRKKHFQDNHVNPALHSKRGVNGHDKSPYPERHEGFRHKSNIREDTYLGGYQSRSSGTSEIKDPVVMLEDTKEIQTPVKHASKPSKPSKVALEKAKYRRLKESKVIRDGYGHRHKSQKSSTPKMTRNKPLHAETKQQTNQPTTSKCMSQLQEDETHLDMIDFPSAVILQKLKNILRNIPPSNDIMQLLSTTQSTSNSQSNNLVNMNTPSHQQTVPSEEKEVISNTPALFANLLTKYRKHEGYKLGPYQVMKKQQELIVMEAKKLAKLEQILGHLKKDDF